MSEQNANQFFSNPDANNDVGSLSDYIARHLQRQDQPLLEQPEPETSKPNPLPPNFKQPAPSAGAKQNGLVLHHLDSQLANRHLERYLPTPTTRVQMTRERLTQELNEIYEQLKHFRQFEGTEYQQKIEVLETRSQQLKRKIFELDQQLTKLNPLQSMFRNLTSLGQNGNVKRNWTLIPNPNPLRNEVATINHHLASLTNILDAQLHDPNLTPEQLGRLINQYDHQLRRAEKLREELAQQRSIKHQFGQWMKAFNQRPSP